MTNKIIENIEKELLDEYTELVKKYHPQVHAITNIVTVNDCANVLHAVGAAPIMAHYPLEVDEVQNNSNALVCNLGAIDDFGAMKIAAARAGKDKHPFVIDPVGVACNSYRREKFMELVKVTTPSCVRGNYSEIKALNGMQTDATGVDVGSSDENMDDKFSLEMMDRVVIELASKLNTVVVASGTIDIISDGVSLRHVTRGTWMFTKITGAGCMSTVIIGAYLAAALEHEKTILKKSNIMNSESYKAGFMEAATAACTAIGICGERAESKTREMKGGSMTFRTIFIDELSLMQRF